MPTVRFVERYPLPVGEAFAFFRRPADVTAVAPAGAGLTFVGGPDAPAVGERYAVEVRRFGMARVIETEVVAVAEPTALAERQADGPFRSWSLTRQFAPAEGGTELTETIDFEPPGGLLGLMLTAAAVEAELAQAYEGRPARVMALLAARSGAGAPT